MNLFQNFVWLSHLIRAPDESDNWGTPMEVVDMLRDAIEHVPPTRRNVDSVCFFTTDRNVTKVLEWMMKTTDVLYDVVVSEGFLQGTVAFAIYAKFASPGHDFGEHIGGTRKLLTYSVCPVAPPHAAPEFSALQCDLLASLTFRPIMVPFPASDIHFPAHCRDIRLQDSERPLVAESSSPFAGCHRIFWVKFGLRDSYYVQRGLPDKSWEDLSP